MIVLDFQTVAQVAASRALNTVLEGLVLAGFSWVALGSFGARSSMTRFAVWFSTLLVIAGLPLLSFSNSASPANLRLPELTLSSGWAARLFMAWALIAGALLARVGFSLWHIHLLRKAANEVDVELYPALAVLARDLPRRRVKFLVSNKVRVPAALGFFHPAVVLPAWALRDLSSDELRAIVLHELAHLRRWDDWTNLVQKIVKALFFFHPAVWWIDSRLVLEREIACDDLVLEQTSSAQAYAASLVSLTEKIIAEKMRMGKALALAQSAVGRVKEVSLRVARILDSRPRSNRGLRPALVMVGTLALVTVGAMPYVPELVSFGPAKSKTLPLSADSTMAGPVSSMLVPAKWGDKNVSVFPVVSREPKSIAHTSARPAIRKSQAEVVPVKATLRKTKSAPKVVLTKGATQPQPVQTVLVMRSTQLDESGMPMWTFSVWRITSANGQTVQEMIVMNSI